MKQDKEQAFDRAEVMEQKLRDSEDAKNKVSLAVILYWNLPFLVLLQCGFYIVWSSWTHGIR